VPLKVPPLRERREDIPGLIEALQQRIRQRHGLTEMRLAPSVHQRLISYSWPGNVRQLENVLERLMLLAAGDVITADDLPEELISPSASSAVLWPALPEEGLSLEVIERELISRALEKFKGNQTQAARYLDISRRTLIYRMEKHGLAASDSADLESVQ
jgi:two-component system NtrC family response regulator